ncbi:hypothetical protein EGI22_10720 [Lacihabitans sp. LS3-19]|uniref:hypothetical protein n=1 Tax=Lacihabitans sp. LS3-19 TaxID=2487335 RepID=UPI0020CF3C00|nr:hypothetical protein [Lacihabitans sp. LS3-19]MCP9768386.1 hypothetical protein [Lacihabitans sp. LS3-19]
MNRNWVSPKTIIGPVATGKYYFPRKEIVSEIWFELGKGNYIILAAPRRVGKTSVMRDLEENPEENYIVKFSSVQAIKSESEFYEHVYRLVLSCLSKTKKAKFWVSEYFKSKKITEVSFKNLSLKFGENSIDYLKEINDLFENLDSNSETIVLLLDELPEVLYRLHKEGKTTEAKSILKQLRVWRQSNYNSLRFVFAGSVGIHYVVSAIEGRTSDLNDLNNVQCTPLSIESAQEFVEWTIKGASIQIKSEQIEYLLNILKGYITPYFLNLIIDEIDKVAQKNNEPIVSNEKIDLAFQSNLKNLKHFNDWQKRLRDYMPDADFKFVNEILTHIAHRDAIQIQKIYDIAVNHDKTIDYMSFIFDLKEDGYIIEHSNDSQNYVFRSPVLRAFWKIINPIYHG